MELLRRSTLPNLYNNHHPFQIDLNFGGTSAIADMLVQSHAEEIHLLPCLPLQWPNVFATGLRAWGQFTVDITWENGKLKLGKVRELTLRALSDQGGDSYPNLKWNDESSGLLSQTLRIAANREPKASPPYCR